MQRDGTGNRIESRLHIVPHLGKERHRIAHEPDARVELGLAARQAGLGFDPDLVGGGRLGQRGYDFRPTP